MSVAHLRVLKSARPLSGASTTQRVAVAAAAFCGATREPVYRTVDEAEESGLDICASCLADFRKQRKAR
jgi:hypothetical protein